MRRAERTLRDQPQTTKYRRSARGEDLGRMSAMADGADGRDERYERECFYGGERIWAGISVFYSRYEPGPAMKKRSTMIARFRGWPPFRSARTPSRRLRGPAPCAERAPQPAFGQAVPVLVRRAGRRRAAPRSWCSMGWW